MKGDVFLSPEGVWTCVGPIPPGEGVYKILASTDSFLTTCGTSGLEYGNPAIESMCPDCGAVPPISKSWVKKNLGRLGSLANLKVVIEFEDDKIVLNENGSIKISEYKHSYTPMEVADLLTQCCSEVSCVDGSLRGKDPKDLYNWIRNKLCL